MVEISQSSKESISDFAKKIRTKPDVLLKQLKSAGIVPEDAEENYEISQKEKESLLAYLRKGHSGASAKTANEITLKRSKAKVIGKGGVTVKVLSKRTYKRKISTEVQPEEIKSTEENTQLTEQDIKTTNVDSLQKATPEIKQATETQEVIQAVSEVESNKSADVQEIPVAADTTKIAGVEASSVPPSETDEKKSNKRTLKKSDKRKKTFEEGNGESKGKQSRRREKTIVDERSSRGKKRDQRKRKPGVESISQKHAFELPTQPQVHEVIIPITLTVAELAKRMSVKAAEVIKQLMQLGMMATINQPLDQETAQLLVEEMGHKAVLKREDEIELAIDVKYETDPVSRPSVVTIMGHVDHGKTSLLDYIRSSKVTAKEAGGITQHIGAYQISMKGSKITFLDTPGHAAFSTMRARGAKVTDIVILVVAADDGVMPQTLEAVKHAKAANVPMIVAVNKIDKVEADAERIRNELSQHGVISEEWGGDTQFVNVSAKSGEGMDKLLDAILLQSEILELKEPNEGPAKGVVIESRKDKGRGVMATILVQQGCLKVGNIVVAGIEFGRVRAMLDENGQPQELAIPATPIEILGLNGTPNAGDSVVVVPDERKARELVEYRRTKARDQKLARQQSSKLEGFFEKIKEGEITQFNVVLKADVHGSAEALTDSLQKLSNDEIRVNIVSAGVGAISESDVNLALASKAVILGFNVRADATARQLIEREGISLYYFSVIYDVIDRIKSLVTGMLAPRFEDKIIGVAIVRDVFRSSKLGAIAGCMVEEGVVKRNKPIRVLRDNVVIYEGELESLRRFKEEANEVKSGTECGIGVKNYNDVKSGDSIEVFDRIQIERSL